MRKGNQGRQGRVCENGRKIFVDGGYSSQNAHGGVPPSDEWWGWGGVAMIPSLPAGRRSHHTGGIDEIGPLPSWWNQSHGEGNGG